MSSHPWHHVLGNGLRPEKGGITNGSIDSPAVPMTPVIASDEATNAIGVCPAWNSGVEKDCAVIEHHTQQQKRPCRLKQ